MSDELTLTYIDGLMRGREESAELLAAAQAREAVLVKALEKIESETAATWVTDVARAALGVPRDDSALLARLKADRLLVAKFFDAEYGGTVLAGNEIAHIIRNVMPDEV